MEYELKNLRIQCQSCKTTLEPTINDLHRSIIKKDPYGKPKCWVKCPYCRGKSYFPHTILDDFK